MPMPKFVGHLDADAFYCAAERVRDECLRGVPVGVLGNQGACVIAKSYEMKAHGVKTGEPIWEAMKKSPDGVFIKRDFRWYEVLSRAMLAVARDWSPRVEYYSIDEFFFEACPPRGMDHQEYATKIRDAMMERVGVPVTVGIARSRTLAKLISDSAKPWGARAVLDRDQEVKLMEPLPVTEIAGIAGRRQRTLVPWGVSTCLDLAQADRRLIRELLTTSGEALWWELNGEAVIPIRSQRPAHKFLARGGSFGDASSQPTVVFAWLVRNLERLLEELEFHQVRAGRLGVQLWYKDGRFEEAWGSLEAPSDRFDVLLEVARAGLRKVWHPRGLACRMEIVAGKLAPRSQCQMGLFDRADDRGEAVASLKKAVNDRHGRFRLRSAATLPLAEVYGDATNGFDICDVRGKACF
ncbi:DNA polymerase Y family protein [Tundrisphaera sp. TA3]|uniref:DNA polymerase Y family protein n=1 Tax=Tundrisphaera sp. TA3 TaxID=3435775 RepID=UPI003EBD3F98